MVVTNPASGTTVEEIAEGIHRIHTPVVIEGAGGFSFNQYLVVDEEPLLFHTGPRRMFPLVREAVAHVLPVEEVRWVAFSHVESDESGSLNEWLAAAPRAVPLCGSVAALVQVSDLADRPPRALADGEAISLGHHRVRWLDATHLPHAWDCGFLCEETTATLFCGDLFTQPGSHHPALTEGDILGPSEAFRDQFDYFSHTRQLAPLVEKLAATQPTTLACMHGSAWRGDGAALLRELGAVLASDES